MTSKEERLSRKQRKMEEEFRRYEMELNNLQRKHLRHMVEEERASRKGVAWEGTQWDLKTFHEVTGWKRERKVRHMVVHDKTDDDYGGDDDDDDDEEEESKEGGDAKSHWQAGLTAAIELTTGKDLSERRQKSKKKKKAGPKPGQTLRDGDELQKAGGKLDRLQPMISSKLWGVRVVQASAGYGHTMVVTECGRVYTFGRGHMGQLGTGKVEDIVRVPFLVDVPPAKAVAAGMMHSLVLTRKGFGGGRGRGGSNGRMEKAGGPALLAFGDGRDGQLGIGRRAVARSGGMVLRPTPVKDDLWREAEGEGLFDYADDDDDDRDDGGGPRSSSSSSSSSNSSDPRGSGGGGGGRRRVSGGLEALSRMKPFETGVFMVRAGQSHTCILDHRGVLFTCGSGTYGQLGHGNVGNEFSPKQVHAVRDIVFTKVAAGAFHTVALSDVGSLWTFGRGDNGQLGHGMYTDLWHPEIVTGDLEAVDTVVVDADAGSKHTVAVTSDGGVWAFGDGRDGQLGTEEVLETCSPLEVDLTLCATASKDGPVPFRASRVSCGGMHSLVRSDRGCLAAFGFNGRNGRLGLQHTVTQFAATPVTFFAEESGHSDKRYTHKVVDALMPGELKYGKIDKDLHDALLAENARDGDTDEVEVAGQGTVRGGNNVSEDMVTTVKGALKEMALENSKLRFRRMFIEVDVDKSGFIDKYEFRDAFRRLGKRTNMRMIKRVIDRFDTDGNGTVDEMEYMAYMEQNLRKKRGVFEKAQDAIYSLVMGFLEGAKEAPQLVPQTYQYFFKMFMTECAKLGIPKLTEKIVKRMTDPGKQPRLTSGVLDLSETGFTDRHFTALVRTLKRVPILSEINLKLNSITDESMYEMMKTFDYFVTLGQRTTRETVCIGCGEEAQYGTPTSPYARCMLCGETTYRPVYFLHKLHITDVVDAAHLQKWSRYEFDQEATRRAVEMLRGPPMPRAEFEEAYFALLKERVKVFRKEAYANRYTRAMQRNKQRDLVSALSDDFRGFGKEKLGSQLVRYYGKAAYEIKATARSARIAIVRQARDWFHATAPCAPGDIVDKVAELFSYGEELLLELIWTYPEVLAHAQESVRNVAAIELDHYLHYNDCVTIVGGSCGHEQSAVVTKAGGLALFGFEEGIVEHFTYRVIDGLGEKWQKKITEQREKAQIKNEKMTFKEAKLKAMEDDEERFREESIRKYEQQNVFSLLELEAKHEDVRSRLTGDDKDSDEELEDEAFAFESQAPPRRKSIISGLLQGRRGSSVVAAVGGVERTPKGRGGRGMGGMGGMGGNDMHGGDGEYRHHEAPKHHNLAHTKYEHHTKQAVHRPRNRRLSLLTRRPETR